MTDHARADLVGRDAILKFLTDEETARVSTAEAVAIYRASLPATRPARAATNSSSDVCRDWTTLWGEESTSSRHPRK